MTAAGNHDHQQIPVAAAGSGRTPIVLSGDGTAYLRQVLVTCSQLLTVAHRDSRPASALLADMTREQAGGRSPEGLLYDLSLAVDYLDFAPAARSTR
jgi:hypothetical protein